MEWKLFWYQWNCWQLLRTLTTIVVEAGVISVAKMAGEEQPCKFRHVKISLAAGEDMKQLQPFSSSSCDTTDQLLISYICLLGSTANQLLGARLQNGGRVVLSAYVAVNTCLVTWMISAVKCLIVVVLVVATWITYSRMRLVAATSLESVTWGSDHLF